MTDRKYFTKNSVLIAIDIAKKSHDVLIQWPSGKQKPMKISNTLTGYNRLMESIGKGNPIVAAFEPTADYHGFVD